MGAPKGNINRLRGHLFHNALIEACEQDNYGRLRQGVKLVLKRWQAEGNIRDGEFIRDTLDGRPGQRIELSGENAQGLSSLAILFVDAAARLVGEQPTALAHSTAPLPNQQAEDAQVIDNNKT